MKNIIISFVIFGICVGIFLSQNPRKYANFAESQNNPSLRADSQNLRGNPKDLRAERSKHPPIKQNAESQKSGLPRAINRARNDDFLDSSLRLRSAQNDNLKLDSATKMPQDKFTYLPNNENSAHSSSIADFGTHLLISYFAGSKEGASDVKIMAHFVDKSTLHSTLPSEILSAQTLSILSGKFIKKLGNPLIFKSADGALHFFVVGVSLGGWATSKIYHLQLSDDLETIKLRKELRLGLLGNFSHLVRTPPLMLENGGFMLPLYHELARKYPLVAFFDKNGEFSHALRLNYLKNQLQPTIIALNESECLAFFRNHKAYQNASFLQKCERGGAIWEAPNTTNLKAFDDSSLLLHYKNAEQKSRILLLYNDGKVAESSNSRRSLGLYYLVDSANENISSLRADSQNLRGNPKDLQALRSNHPPIQKSQNLQNRWLLRATALANPCGLPRSHLLARNDDSFRDSSPTAQNDKIKKSQNDNVIVDSAPKLQKDAEFVFLQNIDIVDEAYPNEVSYPSAVIDENALFVGYTYNRKGIKLKKIELAEIERKIAESRGNSSLGMQFRTCKKFWESTDSGLVLSQNFSQIQKPHRKYFDFDSLSESPTNQAKNAESTLDSADSQNLGGNISSLRDSAKQNRGKPPCEKNIKSQGGLPRSPTLARNDDSFRDSSPTAQNDKNSVRVAESALRADSATFSQGGLPHSPTLARNDEILDSSPTAQNDNITNFAESSAESTINYDIFGIYLLFISAFFFLTKSLSKRVKYLALPCFVALISIPFIFVLWDYYSIVNLFYSLFGGASLFCALLCAKYILREVLQACRFCESIANDKFFRDSSPAAQNDKIRDSSLRKCFAQNDKCKGDSANSRNLALTIAIFSIPLFLGHLGLVNFDILRNEIASAIFVSTFIVALFWVDKWASIFALIALILTKSLFGLFDGYLLIFSVVYCVIWAVVKIYRKIIAQA